MIPINQAIQIILQQTSALGNEDVPRPTAGSVVVKARTSMVDGFPYKEEVGGSNPSVPTKCLKFAES